MEPRKFVRVHEIVENPNPRLYLVTEDGKTVGETDLNTASELCDFNRCCMGTYKISLQIQMDPGMTLKIFKYTMSYRKVKLRHSQG